MFIGTLALAIYYSLARRGQPYTISGEPSHPPTDFYEEPGLSKNGLYVQMTTDYRSRILTEKTLALENIRTQRIPAEGPLVGFALHRIRADSIYWKIGLWQDDIVTAINGQPLPDEGQKTVPTELGRVLAASGQPITITVLRGNAPVTFEISDK